MSWSDDNIVKVWDLTTETCLHTISHHTDYVRAGGLCAQQPELVISGGYDHKLAVWDTRYCNQIFITSNHDDTLVRIPNMNLLITIHF